MSDLRDLYQEVILDHAKHPHNRRELPGANREAHGFNPLCGDKVTLYLKLESGIITDISFEGSGCAISTASASMLTEHLKGMKESEITNIFDQFHTLVTGSSESASKDSAVESSPLGKLIIFEGVREFPMRVKCATLPWHTFLAALKNEKKEITTEE